MASKISVKFWIILFLVVSDMFIDVHCIQKSMWCMWYKWKNNSYNSTPPKKWWLEDKPFLLGPGNFSGGDCYTSRWVTVSVSNLCKIVTDFPEKIEVGTAKKSRARIPGKFIRDHETWIFVLLMIVFRFYHGKQMKI